jgi:hypothetical protein
MEGLDLLGVFDTMRARPLAFPVTKARTDWAEDAALRMMESLRRSNVATYVVDIRGKVKLSEGWDEILPEIDEPVDPMADPAAGAFRWQNPRYLQMETARLVAEASGGFAIVDSPDLNADLNRLVLDLDNYYVLGFYPPDPKTRRWHDLEVRVSRPDVKVRHRKGYGSGGPPAPPKNKDPMVALSAGVLPTPDLHLRLHAAPMAPQGKSVPVVVTLEVRGTRPAGLLSTLEAVKVTVLAVDLKKKKVVHAVTRDVDVRLPSPASPDIRYRVVSRLDLKPGAYQLRTSASSRLLDRAGSVYLPVDVPDGSQASLEIGGVLIGHESSESQPVATSMPAAMRLPFAPVLDREFAARGRLRVLFHVWPRAPSGATASIALVDSADAVVRTAAAEPTADGFIAGVPLSGLAAGVYRLRVTAERNAEASSIEVGITIR